MAKFYYKSLGGFSMGSNMSLKTKATVGKRGEMSIEEWHKLVLSYGHLVDRWTKYLSSRNGSIQWPSVLVHLL
ncbi:MAG TPA: hypothetical protein P5523_07490, partial [Bacteroidales bacterium]|nr:hypothetical protein [Bacteroidales bacterium]